MIFETGTLNRRVELYSQTGDPREGDDTILGGPGGDSMHGGAGSDVMNGNEDEDRLFGGDDDDVMWGGLGHDHIYGGLGADNLDVKPLPDTTVWRHPVDDSHEEHLFDILAHSPSSLTYGSPDSYEGSDFIYGGYDRNIMQSNEAGDRLLDWVWADTDYRDVLCDDVSIGTVERLRLLALSDGGVDPDTEGTSGLRELGIPPFFICDHSHIQNPAIQNPAIQNPAIQVAKTKELTTDSNNNTLPDVGDVITYSYTVSNIGDVTLSDVALSDDVEGVLTLSDVAGDGVGVLTVGTSETASSAHTVTQAEFDAGTLTNIATATGTAPLGVVVNDIDTLTQAFIPAQAPGPAILLLIDEDTINLDLFTSDEVNDDVAGLGIRAQLRWFADPANQGKEIVLFNGTVSDPGLHVLQQIPSQWSDSGSLGGFVGNASFAPEAPAPHGVGPGLGAEGLDAQDDFRGPEDLLDKIDGVTPLRADGIKLLEGSVVCGVVYKGDVSVNYDQPINGVLKGDTRGTVAFEVLVGSVLEVVGGSSDTLPQMTIRVRDAVNTCGGVLQLAPDDVTFPIPTSSSEPFDTVPDMLPVGYFGIFP